MNHFLVVSTIKAPCLQRVTLIISSCIPLHPNDITINQSHYIPIPLQVKKQYIPIIFREIPHFFNPHSKSAPQPASVPSLRRWLPIWCCTCRITIWALRFLLRAFLHKFLGLKNRNGYKYIYIIYIYTHVYNSGNVEIYCL